MKLRSFLRQTRRYGGDIRTTLFVFGLFALILYQMSMTAEHASKERAAQQPASGLPVADCVPDAAPQIAQVLRVVDGDTLRVALDGAEYSVRYIGMDTPENTKTREYYGQEASERNAELVRGGTALLYRDVSETDRYGRLLRYVVLPDGTFVNLALVREGYANAATYPPDVSCAADFQAAEQEARENGRGLWRQP